MYFQEVKLVHWRNFEQLEITFPDRLIILKGDNAQGKTNLLEALYFLARGVSFRHAKDQELVKRGEDYCLASTRVWEGNTYFTKKVLIRPGHKREWKLNEHLGQGKRGIWLVGYFPTDSEIVDGPPQRRREFLDEAIGFIYPGHEQLVNQYEQILARRNILLKEHSGGELLDVYTSKLITLGTKIMKGRLQYIQLFLPFLQSFYSRLSGSRGHVHLHYQPAGYDLTGEIEGSLRAVFDKVENEERERGVTLAGPHRDEISCGKEDFDFRYFGSQGEKKTLALSLKMAERS
ncbi:MAG: DNA replication and repair protein RecF, partial [Atribacterota bacterium]